MPHQHQFLLRNVPNAVLNNTSVYNFTNITTVLLKANIFKDQWNIIKHSDIFLMLCTFITDEGKAPRPEKTIMVNTNLTWTVVLANRTINNETLKNIPATLCTATFLELLETIDQCTICPGIVSDDVDKLSQNGGRNGIFRDKKGNIKAQLTSERCIHSTSCKVILLGEAICESCKIYRKTFLTMVSNEKIKSACRLEESYKTASDSHCPWVFLSEEEKKIRIKSCRVERNRTAKKIQRLENKFKQVSKTL